MVRITLAQMRRSVGRLVAAGLAIAIGTAFVAATLLAGGVMDRTGQDAVTARYADADVVVSGTLTDAALAAVRAAPGVVAADVLAPTGVELRGPARDRYQLVLPVASDPRLTPLVVSRGREPGAGEIALPAQAAQALGVTLGGTVTAVWQGASESGSTASGTGSGQDETESLTLVGIVDDPRGAWTASGGAGVAAGDDLRRWDGVASAADLGSGQIVVAGTAGTTAAALRDAVARAVPALDVQTRDEAASQALDQLGSGGGSALVAVVLGFAAIALVVAALVISNTFQVLVAQRARTLALLRAVGARASQLRTSVLVEASIVGLASSLVGLVAGTALAQAMLAVLRRTDTGVPLPGTVHVTWPVVVVPLLLGTAVTLLASLVPARAATRVTAIEALRPLDAPTAHRGAGAVRLGLSVALTALGAVGLAGAVLLDRTSVGSALAPLALGVLFGAVSLVGVLLGAVYWVPPVVRLAEHALAALGPVPRLAAANAVRNPRRTAATSTALVIGVTLVAMMSTGAASARASLDHTLDTHFPVDVEVTPPEGGTTDAALPATLASDVAAIDGVAHAVALRSASVQVARADGVTVQVAVRALTPADAALVVRDPATVRALADGTVLLPDLWSEQPGTVTVTRLASGGGASGSRTTLRAVESAGLHDALVTPATLARIAPDAPVDALYVALAPGADATDVLHQVQDAIGSAPLQAQGPAAERAQYDRVIDVLLAVVVGLLGVAVLIALLGVTNTLSLSVLERRRESATLRAVGLTRGRLRGMLAVEGMLIAGVGAVGGCVLGVLYGWAGAATVLGRAGGVTLAVSWRDLVLVLVVALAAGLLASVLPARSAVRTPPVAALAEE